MKDKEIHKERRAHEQAKRIIEHARIEARRIREHARTQTRKARESTRKVRDQTKETIILVGAQARVATTEAARLFRVNLANTLTLLNGVAGFLSILASMQQQFFLASMLILLGVIFDWLDGKAARAFGEETPLGRELDSLSDLITFGVAPAILVTQISPSLFSYAAGAFFVLSTALRLGRFNVQEMKGVFFGVPTTMNGVLLPMMVVLGFPPVWFPVYLVVFAFLMNTPIRIKKVL